MAIKSRQIFTCRTLCFVVVMSAWDSIWGDTGCTGVHQFREFDNMLCSPEDDIFMHDRMTLQDCKMRCISSASCEAVNYNHSSNQCSMIKTPCVLVVRRPGIQYMLFSVKIIKQPGECYVWTRYDRGGAMPARGIHLWGRTVARGHIGDNDYIGYIFNSNNNCYVSDGSQEHRVLDCQVLVIREGCTAFLQLYNVGDPWLSGAVVAGKKSNGDSIYMVVFDVRSQTVPGHYSPGDTHAHSSMRGPRTSTIMEVLVIVWIYKHKLCTTVTSYERRGMSSHRWFKYFSAARSI